MRGYVKAVVGLIATLFGTISSSAVAELESTTMDDFINSHDVVMVNFYAPWCSVCKDLEPLYEETGSLLNLAKDIKFAKVNCVVEPDLCEKYKVRIYPTIRIFQGIELHEIYNGPRESHDMIRFAERRYHPSVTSVTKETLEDFKVAEEVTVMGYWAAEDKTFNDTFTRVATSLLDEFLFGATNDIEVAKSEGVTQPSVILYKKFDEGKVIYNGNLDTDAIITFVNEASMPLVGQFEPKLSHRYFSKGAPPFAGIFADTASERDEIAEKIKPIAQQQRNRLRFATIDTSKYTEYAPKFNLKKDQFPAFAILDMDNRKFPITQGFELTKEAIAEWVASFLNGELAPHFKSQPVPEKQEHSVLVVVRENYEEIVTNSDQDVILEFYAPWCGHCKRLAPAYENLATVYSRYDPDVRFAAVDATANDIPGHVVSSYPTFKFFPAKAKSFPVRYVGNHTIQDLARFVQDNSLNKIDVTEVLSVAEAANESLQSAEETMGPLVGTTARGSQKDEL